MWPQQAGSVWPAHSTLVLQSLLQEGQAALAPVSGRGQLRSLWRAAQVAVATTQHRQQATEGSRDRRHRQSPAWAGAGPRLDERKDKRLHKGKSCTRRVKTLLCVAGLKTSRKTERSEICWLQHFLCYMCNIFVMNVITKSAHSILF